MSQLSALLDHYRTLSQSEREKGTYFERLIQSYLQNEPCYRDLYSEVYMFADWARAQQQNAQDAGIDLVARTHTGEWHAIQCKLYAADYTLQKKDIDSFFTASGKKQFTHRLIVSTTNQWSSHALDALQDQQPPVTKIDLYDLEQSQIDWGMYKPHQPVALKAKKTLKAHQITAVKNVIAGLQDADRGKLIMACGTGKTFTSLKIAEQIAGKGGRVLFLVPSLSLLSQTLTEWTQESAIPLHSFAVCSDSDVGKKKASNEDDLVPTLVHELRYPATTDSKSLAREMAKRHDSEHMSVVFSTYHSIEVLSAAQKHHQLAPFDLVVCDEAHRTTGAIFESADESTFVKVHDAQFLKAHKRLYMTATPRIYADSAKAKAEQDSVALCSMDDSALYGQQLHIITFSEAVALGLLVDYKVVVLAIQESHVSRRLQKLLSSEDNQLKVDDAARIVGCWKALAKQNLSEDLVDDSQPMKRAVAFCQVIEPMGPKSKAKVHKVSSKNIAAMFQEVVEAYQEQESIEPHARLRCEAAHVDGSMNASQKESKLSWLKAPTDENTCRILSNVRCLSEGVDVPALDAVLFLTPRNSQVDVVQSVGRVMRTTPDGQKKRGYVILPVVIPAGVEPHDALNDNVTYKVVWQVLQALRSHDDRFDAMINKMDLDLNRNILSKMEVVAITDKIASKPHSKNAAATANGKAPGKNAVAAKGGFSIGEKNKELNWEAEQQSLQFEIGEIERAIYAKVVQKCGNRHHWEDWANDIAKIARTHIDRITSIIENPDHTSERAAFQAFADELRDDLNDSISNAEVIEMLAQHLITKPVFDALFAGYSFANHNPISQAMQGVLDALHEHHLAKEADTLERFYASVRQRAEGIDNAAGKQKIVVELYDKFFRNAFPRMTERLGIVYTPVEVVDFIIHSVDHLLYKHFGQSLGSPGVHILDPFTGTGTFITRLLQSGLIAPDELPHKYQHEIHANEIVLLAYYIAAINIEAVYHDLVGNREKVSVEWEVGNRDLDVGNRDSKNEGGEDGRGFDISGSESLAGSHEFDRNGVHGNSAFSQRGDVRFDQPDAPECSVRSIQHSRGERAQESGGIPTISGHSERLSAGATDADRNITASSTVRYGKQQEPSEPMRNGRPSPHSPTQIPKTQPLTPPTPHSPSPTYTPFPGILLTDTFQLYEKEDLISALMVDNSERRKRQKELDITVIIGNPPYSVGQSSANDNNANVGYPCLDERIRSTYAERSTATNKNALYDSYIRAIRWASDRVGQQGIIGFVTNAGFVEANTADGLRQCLAEEFSNIYIFHLRGNQRTQGETSRKEGGKIFGSGSRAPIAISFLVKDPAAKEMGQIHFCDIGDYLSREAKLEKIAEWKSVAGISEAQAWQCITPDAHGDWLKQRDDRFAEFIVLGDKDGVAESKVFANYSSGLKTQRDAWCYNPSRTAVEQNMARMITFYNSEVKRFDDAHAALDRKGKEDIVDKFIDADPTKISWTRALKQDLVKDRTYAFEKEVLIQSVYRPYSKQWLYYNRRFNEMVYQMPRIFPDATAQNRVICVSGVGARSFSTLITDTLPCLDNIEKGQCFPLYLYEEATEAKADDLFASNTAPARTRRDAITKEGLEHFQKAYPGESISREDVFYYIYGLLHSPDYRERYADNLSKELPRIPCVKKAADFWAFSQAGRELAELHIGYETVEPYAGCKVEISSQALTPNPHSPTSHNHQLYRVEKMRYGKQKENGKSVDDKTVLVYNNHISIAGIPLTAYNYVVNGKAALDWVVERQCVKTDKASGIVNDANAWAIETMQNPRYPLDLFLRVVTVSLETNRIVNALPALDIA